jgi:hypothetical protein
MVVPKMVRPSKSVGPSAPIAEAPAPPRQSPRDDVKPEIQTAEQLQAEPGPNLYTASNWFRKVLVINLLIALAVTALVVTIFWHRSTTKEIETNMGGAGWMRYVTEKGDPGVKQSRQLVLYRPSLGVKDGRLEFTWTVDPIGVAWVFRAKNLGNYYAMRLKLVQPGPSPTLSIEHFTVANRVEGPHTEKTLVFSRNDPVMRVRMDVFGPTFTVYLQGIASEYWTDGRLTTGGFGFLENWYQGADIKSVRMSLAERGRIEPRLQLHNLQEFFAMHLVTPRILPALGGD